MTFGWFVMLLIIVGHLLRIAYGDSPPADGNRCCDHMECGTFCSKEDNDDGAPWT